MTQLKVWDGSAWVDVPGAIGDHGVLTGLGDDDHPQYLLADGSRSLTGNLGVDGGVTVDGRDISADGAKLDGIEAGAVADHGNLAGLGDDDHTQYALADGSRDISGLLTFLAGLTVSAGTTTLGLFQALGNGSIFKSAPLWTLYNTVDSDADGGRRSDTLYGGDTAGGTPHYLARIRCEHDGAAADQMARMIFYLNLTTTGLGTGDEVMRLDQYGLKTFGHEVGNYVRNTGTQTLTGGTPGTWTTIQLPTTVREDGSFTIGGTTANEVDINYTGWVRAHFSIYADGEAGTLRGEAEWRLMLNGALVAGSTRGSYHRSVTTSNIEGRGSASCEVLLAVTSGDALRLEGRAIVVDVDVLHTSVSLERIQQP